MINEASSPGASLEQGCRPEFGVVEWMPIETAPRDGRRFLTWDAHYGVRIGLCFNRADHDDWLSYADNFGGSSKGGMRATHWMPLPAPPTKAKKVGTPSSETLSR